MKSNVLFVIAAAAASVGLLTFAAPPPSGDIAASAAPKAPAFANIDQWFDSPPLQLDALRGKVVLVDFWTYSCINCLNHLPYVKAWNEKYMDQGLVVYKTTEKKIQALLAEQPPASPSPGS